MSDTRDKEPRSDNTIKTITKQTTVSVALVVSMLTAAYQAGQLKQRVDTLEVETDRTGDVLKELRNLSEKMDTRLQILEDRQERAEGQVDLYGPGEQTETGLVAHQTPRGAGFADPRSGGPNGRGDSGRGQPAEHGLARGERAGQVGDSNA